MTTERAAPRTSDTRLLDPGSRSVFGYRTSPIANSDVAHEAILKMTYRAGVPVSSGIRAMTAR